MEPDPPHPLPPAAPPLSAGCLLQGWSDQQRLLERQHERLDRRLEDLIAAHGESDRPPAAENTHAQRLACRRLLQLVRLHFGLEERWLRSRGVLLPSHRSAHREVMVVALTDLNRAESDRRNRLEVLETLQSWLTTHNLGPDAAAYALATRIQAAAGPGP
ncbi:MAG: hemerythrin domain-containing protein [Prochlorococcaceae cyanobacterium]|jgi:hemerythrin